MARNRLNPWPSVADLFSALTVVGFASLIAIAVGAVVLTETEANERDAAETLAQVFKTEYKQQSGQSVTARSCEDRKSDQCIEMQFRFVRNKSELLTEGESEVSRACEIYRHSVNHVIADLARQNRQLLPANFKLQIEGHTDSTVPQAVQDERERFLYNWRLSSERAQSVLYLFKECGVSPEMGYSVSSVGLAATRPLCMDVRPDEKCHEQNRRTTMRIRVEQDAASLHYGEKP